MITCETHGVQSGDTCEPCAEHRRAAELELERDRLRGQNTATALRRRALELGGHVNGNGNGHVTAETLGKISR